MEAGAALAQAATPKSAPIAAVAAMASAPHAVTRTMARNTGAPPVVPVQLAEVPPPSVVTLPNDVAAANLGTVNVTSSPPANVVLDGRPIGKAPRLVQVPAGVHKLVFIHPLYGRQSQSVNVTAGQTASVAASF